MQNVHTTKSTNTTTNATIKAKGIKEKFSDNDGGTLN
jgi:hypothetical protein